MNQRQKKKRAKATEVKRLLAEKDRQIAELRKALSAARSRTTAACGQMAEVIDRLIQEVENHGADYHHKTDTELLKEAKRVAETG